MMVSLRRCKREPLAFLINVVLLSVIITYLITQNASKDGKNVESPPIRSVELRQQPEGQTDKENAVSPTRLLSRYMSAQSTPAIVKKAIRTKIYRSSTSWQLKSSPMSWSIDSRVIERQLRRRHRVADVCAARLLEPKDSLANHTRWPTTRRRHELTTADGLPVPVEFYYLLADDERQLLYCEVPKVACTSWKQTLVFLTGQTNATSPDQISSSDVHTKLGNRLLPRLYEFSPAEIQYRLNTYFKFLFVRDPLSRLRSAYLDKFHSGQNALYNKNFGRYIVSKYRHNPTNSSLQQGNDVRHGEFVKYLIDPSTLAVEQTHRHWYGMDAHWRSYEDLCHPCFVGYDFIGKYETLSDDVEHVMKLTGTHGLAQFPSSSSSSSTGQQRLPRSSRSSSGAVTGRRSPVHGYDGVPLDDVKQLMELYDDDYTLFGYPHPV